MNFSSLLEEYFRHVYHPRCSEIQIKYPHLWRNPAIQSKLVERYPGSRLTDEEYAAKWMNAMQGPSFLESLKPIREFTGGTLTIPFTGE